MRQVLSSYYIVLLLSTLSYGSIIVFFLWMNLILKFSLFLIPLLLNPHCIINSIPTDNKLPNNLQLGIIYNMNYCKMNDVLLFVIGITRIFQLK